MKCVYIYNPKSGKEKSKSIKDLVETTLKEKFDVVDVMPTKKRGDATELARDACGKYDVLVVSGGDGTMNEIINGIANQENRPKIGYIPTGTVNDLAHTLKIPSNPKKALKIILDGDTIKHDIFKVNEKYGIYVCGFGMFTACSYRASQDTKKKIGKLAYYIDLAKDFGKGRKFKLKFTSEENQIDTQIILGLIINSKYVSGYKINKMASHNDGFVNIILFKEKKEKGISFKILMNIVRMFLFGIKRLKNSKNCIIFKANKFHVDIPDNMTLNIDGECGCKGDFDFEVLKEHVEIFVNK